MSHWVSLMCYFCCCFSQWRLILSTNHNVHLWCVVQRWKTFNSSASSLSILPPSLTWATTGARLIFSEKVGHSKAAGCYMYALTIITSFRVWCDLHTQDRIKLLVLGREETSVSNFFQLNSVIKSAISDLYSKWRFEQLTRI